MEVRLGYHPSSRIHINKELRAQNYRTVNNTGEDFLSFSSTIQANLKIPEPIIQVEYRILELR